MKNNIFSLFAVCALLLASCSKGYDQNIVDKLDKNSPDYFKVLIEQANYALDDAENAPDLEKWDNDKENEKEAEFLVSACLGIGMTKDDPSFPAELKEDAEKLLKRFDKLADKLNTKESLSLENMSFEESDDNESLNESETSQGSLDRSEFTGTIDNKYRIHMQLDFISETGSYKYLNSGSGDSLSLEIDEYDPETGNIKICEYNDKGSQTGLFEGRFSDDGTINGTFTNYKGKQMTFSVVMIN